MRPEVEYEVRQSIQLALRERNADRSEDAFLRVLQITCEELVRESLGDGVRYAVTVMNDVPITDRSYTYRIVVTLEP